MPQPNFFLVGAPKAGTTSLYYALRQHPDIYMSPIKEPCHFSTEVRPENFTPAMRNHALKAEEETLRYLYGAVEEVRTGGIVRSWENYLRLFSAARGQRAIGEASVGYLASPHAPAGIAQRIPHAKIIMVLRSPADRAFSHYLHCISCGLIRCSFREYVVASQRNKDEQIGIHHPFLSMGFYAVQIRRYLEFFARDHLGIWIYEETLQSQPEFHREVFSFLGVDDGFEPESCGRHHEPRVPRVMAVSKPLHWARMTRFCREQLPAPLRASIRDVVYRPNREFKMKAEDRATMLDFYRADIAALEGILGRNLDIWLKDSSPVRLQKERLV